MRCQSGWENVPCSHTQAEVAPNKPARLVTERFPGGMSNAPTDLNDVRAHYFLLIKMQ